MIGAAVGFSRRRDPFIIDDLLQLPDTLGDTTEPWEAFQWKLIDQRKHPAHKDERPHKLICV